VGKKVFIIHTSDVSVDDMNNLFEELAPEAELYNIVDDSLLPEVLQNAGVTKEVTQRICAYAYMAEIAGADLIFNQCSSVGESADLAKELVSVPLVKVDERMAEVACEQGNKIGVVATLGTTLGPTVRLVQATARKMNKEVEVVESLCDGAFEILRSGNVKKHNEMVIEKIEKLYDKVDVVICAQGSMVPLVAELGNPPIPVLTSPRLGVEKAVEVLKTLK
jgi:aspartate/glutamate racemase